MSASVDPKAVVARLACGLPFDHPDPASLPGPWGRLAADLLRLPPERRGPALRRVLAKIPGGDRLAHALLAVDPHGRTEQRVAGSGGAAVHGSLPDTHYPLPETWEPPLPFSEREVPTFPVQALPPWMADFIIAVAIATQTPTDLAGCLGLAMLSTACAGRFEVRPWGDWVEPVNLFIQVVLPPGSRKSAVFGELARPVRAFELATAGEQEAQIALAEDLRRVAEQTLQRARDAAARASVEDRPERLAEVARLSAELQTMRVPVGLCLIVDDCSPERLAGHLREQGGRIAVLSEEGGVFDVMSGRYSATGMPNIDHYLKGHAGDPILVDRVSRGPERVPRPAITMGLSVQPIVLRGLMDRPGFHGKGLLARFLYSIPVSLIGTREDDVPPVSPHVRAAYLDNLTKLLNNASPTPDARVPNPVVLSLSEAAERSLRLFSRELEPRLGRFGDLARLADWGAKVVGTVARIAALIHVGRYAAAPDLARRPIEDDTARAAVALGRYFIDHASAAYDAMGQNPLVDDAQYLIDWFRETGRVQFTKRELLRATSSRFRSLEALDPVVRLLERRAYVRRRPAKPYGGMGRPPSSVYEVNPLGLVDNVAPADEPARAGG